MKQWPFSVSIKPVWVKNRKAKDTMEKAKLDRINELAHKSKKEGLTETEKEEQRLLRQEFLAEIRADVRASLESIEFVEETVESTSEFLS